MTDTPPRLPPITELLPHEPPALALERLTDWHPGRATARLTIREDALLLHGGRVDAAVTLEYMAQTVAACLGYEAFCAGAGARVGMVVACRELTLERPWLQQGEELEVQVERVRGTDHVSHFRAAVRAVAEDAPVARATLTLVHGDRPPGS